MLNRINPKKSTAKHIKIKLLQTEERKNLESSQRKTMHYLHMNTSCKTMEARSNKPFSNTKRKRSCSPQILYLEKLSFRNEEERKTSNEEFLEEFVTGRHTLKEWLKQVLKTERK